MLRPNSSNPSKLAMHRGTHVITKVKQKIRIIHIFAPEIIKTDVENFRELVQRLTGKPSNCEIKPEKSRKKLVKDAKESPSDNEPNKKAILQSQGQRLPCLNQVEKLKVEAGNGSFGGKSLTSSGFLDEFADLNYGFMHELDDGFPLTIPSTSLHHLDLFGDTRFS